MCFALGLNPATVPATDALDYYHLQTTEATQATEPDDEWWEEDGA